MLRELITLMIAGGFILSACATSDPSVLAASRKSNSSSGQLTVFAAASLTEAFTAIGKQFEAANPGMKVTFNFAGSQQLAQQIIQGAPADVFASANQPQIEAVVRNGLVDHTSVQTFTNNRLVVITPKNNPAHIQKLSDLRKPGLKLVLAAKEVPVGSYSLQFLDKASQDPSLGADYKAAVLKNVVSYEENVRAVLSKVILGEADAGIVYRSDISRGNADKVDELDIPDNLNVIASYYIAPVQASGQKELAKAFTKYVMSAAGKDTLRKYGFTPTR